MNAIFVDIQGLKEPYIAYNIWKIERGSKEYKVYNNVHINTPFIVEISRVKKIEWIENYEFPTT